MNVYVSVLLVGASLLTALLAEVMLPPDAVTWPVLFALPVLLACLWLSPQTVAGAAALSVLSYLGVSGLSTNSDPHVVMISAIGLSTIAAIAYQIAQGRDQMAVTQQDLSLRERELERQLALATDREEQVQMALGQTPVSAFAQDEHLRYSWVINQPPFGDGASVIGRSDDEIFTREQASCLRETKHNVLHSGVRAQQELILTAHGHPRTYELYVHPLRAKDHTIIGVTGTAVDVSQWAEERKQMRALVEREGAARSQAEAKQRRLRRMYLQVHSFVSSVAHELSQPLTVISGFTQRLQHRAWTRLDETEHRMIRMILDAGQRAQRMVRDLRTTSTIETGNFDIQPSQMDLADAVQQVVDELPDSERARIVFTAPQRVEGVWDRDRLMQVTANLLSNALKYSGSESKVEVDVRHENRHALLSVRDHGPGIAPEDQPKLFEAYTRLDGTAEIEGSGLGLYVARRIVEAHEGRIWVDSGPRRGSAFHVSLPVGNSGYHVVSEA